MHSVKKKVWLMMTLGLCFQGGYVLAVADSHPQHLLDSALKTQHDGWKAEAKQNQLGHH